MKHIEKKAYKEADAVVSLLPNALDHMAPFGLDADRFWYIPNGFWADEWNNPTKELNGEIQHVFDWCEQNNKLKIVYTGSHGPPNALDQLLALQTEVTKKDVPFHFILIGEGIQKAELMAKTQDQNIHFIDFLPKVHQTQIPAILGRADICFIGWQNKPIYKLGISPNKLVDYFQAAKPILHAYCGFHDPVIKAKAGITIEPYNPGQLYEALNKFCEMTDQERRDMGNRGKQYALQNFEWSVLGEKYSRLCQHLICS
jgi:glycosyltransferase involved in cell wall biosynthesis